MLGNCRTDTYQHGFQIYWMPIVIFLLEIIYCYVQKLRKETVDLTI